MIGKTISHYRILEKLGEGGMGVVYKAEDTKLDRMVALKFLPVQFSVNEEEKARFVHEAKASAALDHPNICSIHEIDETDDGQMFISMACYEGENLKERINKGPLKIDEAVSIALQLAEGLNYAHKQNIIHRDIKSANIFLTRDGLVKILDFGLAKLKGQSKLTKESTTLGTASYMSPEQTMGKEVDLRADIWSLGVVLYETMTGQLPFKGDYDQAVVYSILNEDPQPVTAIRTGVPMELEVVINKLLSKKPSERYQHVDDLLVDLTKIKAKSQTGLSATKREMQVSPKSSSRRWAFPLIILAVVCVAIAGYFITKDKKTEKPETKSITELSQKKWQNSIAVLPFRDFSSNKDQESFCDGMTDAIIGKLTQLKQLKIISLTSVLQYKGQAKNIKKIGQELDVATILEGSIQKEGNKLRIIAQLINVADDSHLWQNTYNRELKSLFAIQDDISQAIVNGLKIKLLEDEKDLLKKHHTQSTEAYNLYSQGRFYWRKRSKEGFEKSIEFYNQALKIDPDYALAYSGLADTYSNMAWSRYLPQKQGFIKAKEAAYKALELNERLAEAHNSLAYIMLDYEWNFEGAKQEFERAIQLNPGYANAFHWYTRYFVYKADLEKAILMEKKALELDPLSPSFNYFLAVLYYWTAKYDEAETLVKRGIEMHPDFTDNYMVLAGIYIEKSMYEKAMDQLAIIHETPLRLEFWTLVLEARKGNKKKLEAFLDKYANDPVSAKILPFDKAFAYAFAGNADKVFEWLERAYKTKDPQILLLKVDPGFKKYHNDKRFKNLVKKIGLE